MSTAVATSILDIRTDLSAALGSLKALERGMGDVRQSTAQTSSALQGVGKLLAGAFTATAIVAAGKQVLDYAGHVSDLSARLKVSTTTIQQWEGVFGPAGVSIDTVAKASGELSNRLVGGDKSAVAALEKMGLSVEQLKAMAPEQRFTAVADAVGRLQSDAERLYASKTLFGKGGTELLAALDGHLQENIDKFTQMGLAIDEETLAAADEFGDQLGFLGKQLMALGAQVLGPLLPVLSAFGQMLSWLGREVIGPVLNVAVKGAMTALGALWSTVAQFLANIADVGVKLPGVGDKFATLAGWLRQSADNALQYATNLWEQKDATDRAGAAAQQAAPKVIGLGGASEEASKKAAKLAKELKELRDKATAIDFAVGTGLYGKEGDVADPLARYMDGLKQLTEAGDKARAIDLEMRRGGEQGVWNIGISPELDIERTKNALSIMEQLAGTSFSNALSAGIATLPGIMQQALTGGGGVTGALQALGSTVGSTVGRGLFNAGGALSGVGNKLAGIFGSSFGLALPGIGAALGSLVGPALAKLWGGLKKLFGGPSENEMKGREAQASFQREFASFEAMVNAVGDAYAATGKTREQAARDVKAMLDAERKGPEAVQAWITKFREAMSEAEALREKDKASADKLKAEIAAAGQARMQTAEQELQTLIGRRDELVKGIAAEAPEEVMGVIEAQQRGQLAVLEDEIQQKADAYAELAKTTGQEMADAIVEALRNIRIEPVRVPVALDGPPGLPAVPMAAGGFGTVTRPTLFLAGEAGPEQFAFSGANRGFDLSGLGDKFDQLQGYLTGRFRHDLARAVRDQRQLMVGAR